MKQFLKDTLITKISNGAGAGTTDVVSSVLDMAGYDSVLFVADLGTVTDGSVLQLKPSENDANSTSGGTALTGGNTPSVTASGNSNSVLASEVIRPAKRYVFCTLSRGTQNAVVNTLLAIQYKAKAVPVTQPASLIASAIVEGGN